MYLTLKYIFAVLTSNHLLRTSQDFNLNLPSIFTQQFFAPSFLSDAFFPLTASVYLYQLSHAELSGLSWPFVRNETV
jgi:hypothetical protein